MLGIALAGAAFGQTGQAGPSPDAPKDAPVVTGNPPRPAAPAPAPAGPATAPDAAPPAGAAPAGTVTAPTIDLSAPAVQRPRRTRRARRPSAATRTSRTDGATEAAAKAAVAPPAAARPNPQPAATAAKPAPKPAAPAAERPFLTEYQDPAGPREMPLGRVLLDLFVKLLVVLAIAYGSIYALRGVMVRQGVTPGRRGHLRVLESASLGPSRSIHLVRVGTKVMVVGSTPEQVTALSEIDDPDTLAQLNAAGDSAFSSRLAGALAADGEPAPGSGQGAQAVGEQVRGGVQHLWQQVQEVRGLRSRKGGDG